MPPLSSPQSPRSIFLEAVEKHSPSGWPEYLDSACSGDNSLREQVNRLLDAHGRIDGFMAQPAGKLPATIDMPAAGELVGQMIGRYKMLEQLGEGGMGIVYVAEQTEPVRRRVALKLIKPGMDSRQVIARFEAERQALAMMDHPNIAKILDAGEVGPVSSAAPDLPSDSALQSPAQRSGTTGRPYFVMELVRGLPITDYCDRARLPLRQRLELFITVCQAVQHAHQKGIIHRDLKPSNVLVTLHDGTPVVKVIDFGVAKALNQQLSEHTIYTQFAQMIGTPLYMSPEQAELSALDVDTRSDVYSLGVLLYELLTGQTPFDGATLKSAGFDEMRRIIREDEPPRPSARLSTLGVPAISTLAQERGLDERRLSQTLRGELDWIVMKALEKDRTRRYESASSLATDLRRYLNHLPIQARPTSLASRGLKWRRRNPLASLAIATGILLSLITASAAFWHNHRLGQSLGVAQQLRTEGLERETALRREQYVPDMRLAWQAIGKGDDAEVRRLLQRHGPYPEIPDYVGFEWHYLRHRALLPRLTMTGHRDPLLSIDVSPDERFVASSDRGGEVRIWELDTGKLVKLLRYSDVEVTTVRFSPDGRLLATTGMDKIVHLWSVEDWREVATLEKHKMTVTSLAWSPNGKRLASSDRNHLVHIWNVTELRLERTLQHGDVIRAVAWSPDGRVLATAEGDRGIHLWEADTWRDRGRVGSRNHRFLCIAFSPHSQTIATGGYGNCVRLFDVRLQAEIASVETAEVWSLVFRDDSTLIIGTDGGWEAWHFDRSSSALTALQQPRGGQGKVRGVIPAGGGKLLVTGSEEDHTVAVWDACLRPTKQEIQFEWPEGIMPKRHLVFNADLANNFLRIQRLGDGSQVAQMKCFNSIFPTASPTEDCLAVAESGAEIRIWNTTTWQPVRLVKSPADRRVHQIHFSADGQWLAAGCGEGVAGAWNLQTGEWQQLVTADSDQSCVVQCSPSRNVVACAVFGNSVVELWDLDQVRRLDRLVLDSGAHSICFSPDGRLLAVGETGMEISLWETDTGVKIDTLTGHTRAVTRLAFSPDGRTLVSGSYDETARLWNLATRRDLFVLCHASQFNWFGFVDGSLLVAHGRDNKLRIFPGKGSSTAATP